MKDFVIFLGPTLAMSDPARLAPFDWRPPATQGDVLRAVNGGARVIGLVDGGFEGLPAVWHKEILFALSRGAHVFGASSMGALRAAELHVYGMRGIGAIFDWYASGRLDADDEVAVVHAPAEMGYAPLSVPLVNVRATLDALRGCVLNSLVCEALLGAACTLHFKQRTWKQIAETASVLASGIPDANWLVTNAVDQKAIDARALITAMTSLAVGWPGPFRPDFVFERTDAWDACVASIDDLDSLSEADQQVLDEARLLGEEFDAILTAAAAALLTTTGQVACARTSDAIDAFRRGHGLVDRKRYEAWLAENSLDARDLGLALGRRAAVAALVDTSLRALLAALLSEIKLRGLYPRMADRAERKAAVLAPVAGPPVAFGVGERQMLLEWFCERCGARFSAEDPERLRRALAFPDNVALQQFIRREYLFAGQMRQK